MIDASCLELHLLVGDANLSRHQSGGLLDAVAQAHSIAPQSILSRVSPDSPTQIGEEETGTRPLCDIFEH
jgi:hypothetical protein